MDPLEITGLGKRYGRVEALCDVGFSVRAGEVFGLLGPNGAGKTTTLRIAAGLVRADHGSVRLLGEDARRSRARVHVGYLQGEPALEGDMTGRAVLAHLARFRPTRPPVLRDELLERLALRGGDLARRVRHLSHGTRQKLALVAALQHDPDLVMLDEPTNGLDPLVQRGLREHVAGRAAAGRAVLLSSHVLSEVEAVCTRVGILGRGRLLAVEDVARLRERAPRRLRVRVRAGSPDELARLPGVAAFRAEGPEAEMTVSGDPNPVLRALARLDVEQFVFPEAQLEDVFMGWFGEGSDGRG